MGDADEIKPWLRDFGMVIVDECHHVPAVSFEQVLKSVSAKYIYGLTATPKRQDGHHPILHMYIGDIRYHVDAKQQAKNRPFAHIMIPRFTGARFHLDDESKTPAIGQYYDQMTNDDLRNNLIIEDVLSCIKEGRSCLLLSAAYPSCTDSTLILIQWTVAPAGTVAGAFRPYSPTFLATTLHSFSQNAMPYVQISFTRYRRSTAV